jgi:hemin uptake protein HemP
MMDGGLPRPGAGAPPPEPRDPAPVHDALVLTGGGREARIRLAGTTYTLRITRLGKLILTK